MTRGQATATGFGAVLLWSLLALFTVGSAPVPPLALNALCFAVGGSIGLVWAAARGRLGVLAGVSLGVYTFGTAGMFGFHFFYFSALRLAPPVEAVLIVYLWPLLIVLFSGLLPGERVRTGHVVGALAAFSGAALIVGGTGGGAGSSVWAGYGMAGLAALTWASFSVLSRRLGAVPTEAVAIYCLATAALSALAHLAVEVPAWPAGPVGWAAVLALGLGPVGLAFYVWDIGVKRGDIQLLGVASYAAPLISTLVMIAAGYAEPRAALLVAAVLIAGGAALAARAGGRAVSPPKGGGSLP